MIATNALEGRYRTPSVPIAHPCSEKNTRSISYKLTDTMTYAQHHLRQSASSVYDLQIGRNTRDQRKAPEYSSRLTALYIIIVSKQIYQTHDVDINHRIVMMRGFVKFTMQDNLRLAVMKARAGRQVLANGRHLQAAEDMVKPQHKVSNNALLRERTINPALPALNLDSEL